MTERFIWNEQSAEAVRSQSERAMQGQSSDMRETAAALIRKATGLEAQAAVLIQHANAMLARLPIMTTISYTFTNLDGDIEHSSKEIEDTAASATIASQAAQMQTQANEMRTGANFMRTASTSLKTAATELDRKIESTNALFNRMFEYAQRTDARYAIKMQEIKDRIGAYIYRMEALRDSFDLDTGGIDMGVMDRAPSQDGVILRMTFLQKRPSSFYRNVRIILAYVLWSPIAPLT